MRSTPPSDPPPDPLSTLTLEQYAGVTVALAEGLPLPAILANEAFEPALWPPAHVAWKARLARDGAAGPVFAQFCAKRIVAEDWLTRRVAPIDADLPAWLSFLRAWSDHAAPFALLSAAGLGMNDVARLQRLWARRMGADTALQEHAAKLTKNGPGPLPAIQAQPVELKPFPWSKGALPKPKAPPLPEPAALSGALSVLDLSFYRYVTAKAQIAERPADEARILESLRLSDFPATDAAWQARLESDPLIERDYRRLFEHERSRLRGAAKHAASAPAGVDHAPATPLVAAPIAPLPPPAPGVPAGLAGTSLAVDVPRGPALPFAEPARLRSQIAATSLEVKIPRGAALPFAKDARASLPVVVHPAEPAPGSAAAQAPSPARNALAGTSLALDVPRGLTLPFADRLQIPERSPMPTAQPPAASPAPPPLSLEQHASLSCEIAGAPERALETLARYQLTPAQKRAADQHFAERFARDPAARVAWDQAFATYRAWWLANGLGRVSR